MVEVKRGYVTSDGLYFTNEDDAGWHELKSELEKASSMSMGYSIPKLLAYLKANFTVTRKVK